MHPIAFIEYITYEDGKKEREGPMLQVEELRRNEEWKVGLNIALSTCYLTLLRFYRDDVKSTHQRCEMNLTRNINATKGTSIVWRRRLAISLSQQKKVRNVASCP